MQLVGVQLDIAWEDRAVNHAQVAALLEKSPPKSGALVALPEMFASGFSMNVERIADNQTRATERFLCDRRDEALTGPLVVFDDARDVHAEAAGEHLRQDNQ